MVTKFNNIFGVLEQIIVSGGNFIFAILLSKMLTPSDFGIYSLVWVAIISVASFFNSWFSSPMLSISPSLSQSNSDHFISILTKKIMLTQLVILFLSLLIFKFGGQFFRPEIFFLVMSCVPFFLYDFLRRVAIVKREIKHLVVVNVFLYFSLIISFLYLYDGEVQTIGIIIFLSYLFSSIALLIVYQPLSKVYSDTIKLENSEFTSIWPRHLSFAKWASYSSVLQFITGNAVFLFSSALLSLSDVGLLRLAQTFVSIFNPILVFLDNHSRVYFATILKVSGLNKLNNYFKAFVFKSMLSCMAICLIMGVLGQHLIDYFYPEYLETQLKNYSLLYIILTFFTVTTSILRLRLLILEHVKLIFRAYVFSSVISIAVFYPMILMFGAHGVILVLITTQIVMSFLIIFLRKLEISPVNVGFLK